jgi:hypothetical protein
MTMDIRQVVRLWLSAYAKVYHKPVDDDLVEAYVLALENFTPAILQRAFLRRMKSSKFFPTPAEIREAAEIELELELVPMPRESDADCELCRGTGWKLVKRPEGGEWCVVCACRRKKSA